MQEFAGRVAVVTGAGSGIGEAMARRFAMAGMKVVVADIDGEDAQRTAASLENDYSGQAASVQADVSRSEDVAHVAEFAYETFGAVHLLCNNAGIDGYRNGPLWTATERDLEWSLGVNVYGALNGIRAFVPRMLASGEEGHIVNTVSTAALVPAVSVYGITKHAVLAVTEALDAQLRAEGAPIGVTALCPGHTLTSIFTKARTGRPQDAPVEQTETARADRERRQAVLAEHGIPPEQVAEAVLRGIKAQTLYVVTSDWENDEIERRHAEIMAGTK